MIKLEELPTSSKKFYCQDDVERLSCKKCGFSSHMLLSFIQHKEAGCGNRTDDLSFLRDAYKCRNCEFVSCSYFIMSRHETRCCGALSRTNRIAWWICSHCEFTISYKSVHLDRTKFECGGESCNNTHASLEELKEHATFVHLPRECLKFLFADDCTKTKSIEQFYSEQLRQEFDCKAELNEDRIDEHSAVDARVFGCNKCEFKCKRKPKLSVSKIIKHSESEDGTWLSCHNCEYKSKHNIHQHTASENIKWFDCEECSFRTKTRSQLLQHKSYQHNVSVNVKWFECQECEYKSKRKYNLNLHKIHNHTPRENIKWFQCDECSYKSKTKQHLKQHKIYQHTASENIKWFDCEECSFKAKTRSQLYQHRVSKHTPSGNVKWFECKECSFKAKTRVQVSRHKVRKHFPNANVT